MAYGANLALPYLHKKVRKLRISRNRDESTPVPTPNIVGKPLIYPIDLFRSLSDK